MKRINKIRNHILLGLSIVVTIAIITLTCFFIYQLNIIETRNVTERLNVAIETAWDLYNANDVMIETALSSTIQHDNLGRLILDADTSGLDSTIANLSVKYPGIDYITITDAHGKVLSSTSYNRGETWFLSNLTGALVQNQKPIYTTELMPSEEVAKGSWAFQKKVEIRYYGNGSNDSQSSVFNQGLLKMVLVPVYDSRKNVVGGLSAGIVLNNNDLLPKEYTERVPNTYLSIGVEGVRICSNISVDNFYYPTGTLQDKTLVETIRAGNRFSGKIYPPGGPSLIVNDPIKNFEGKVVGNIGVGAPIFAFMEFSDSNITIIIMISIIIFVLAIFLGSLISGFITRPIDRLQALSKAIRDDDLKPSMIVWQEKHTPIEIQELADSIIQMAKDLMNEKRLLEYKVNERTQQLAATVEKLEAANKYKSQFLANMSHELRTPLNSIIGFAQLLQDKLFGSLNHEQEDHVSTIIESSNHLLDLINDILDLVKLDQHIEKLTPAYLDLEKIFNDLSDLFLPQLRTKSLHFTISVEDDLPQPHWDAQKLKQILINILSNAIKFTPSEGSITLRASKVEEDILISVKDTGVGIPPEMAEKVFLAFVQADSSYTKLYRGVGLGLSISKNLVELHKGKIWLEPNPEGGTMVTFRIPIDPFQDSSETLTSGKLI